MRRLLLAAVLAAVVPTSAPAAHAEPVVCVTTYNGKGVETTVCNPFVTVFGSGTCATYDNTYFDDQLGNLTYQWVRVCVRSVV